MRTAQEGDRDAFDRLAEAHRRGILAAVRCMLGSAADAEDVAQVALLQAWRDIGRLRDPERFSAWLHQIARNRARDYARRRHAECLDPAGLGAAEAGSGADPASRRGLTPLEARDAISALPELYRVAAQLFYVGGLTVRETAGALAVPPGTVKRRLFGARRRLRDSLFPESPPRVDAGGGMRVLEVEDLRTLTLPATDLERVALSPDGRLAAYTVRTAPSGREELRVHDLESGGVRAVTPGWGSSRAPRWSPDGRLLAFVSDRDGAPRLWLWERETAAARRVADTAVVLRPMWFQPPAWLPDGRHLVVKLRAGTVDPPAACAARPPDAPAREVWVSPLGGAEAASGSRDPAIPSWKDQYRSDLAVVDVESGGLRRLTREGWPLGVAVSPDGARIAAMMARTARADAPAVVCDLRVLRVADGAGMIVAEGVSQGFGTEFSWSPDGARIAYTTTGDGPGRLFVAEAGGPARLLHDGSAVPMGNEEGVPPLWSADGRSVYCWAGSAIRTVDAETGAVATLPAPPGRSVYGIVQGLGSGTAPDFGLPGTVVVLTRDWETRRTGLWRLAPDGAAPAVAEAARNLVDGVLLGGDACGTRLVGFVESLDSPGDLHVFDATPGGAFAERRVSRLNPSVPGRTARAELMRWTDAGGRSRLAAVVLPEGAGPWPVVLRLYGGEAQSSHIHEFGCGDPGWSPLLLTARGYAVVLPDLDADGPEPADDIASQAVACLDAAAAQGYADARRAAIAGHSYGGYSALAAITRSDRFRAAIVSGAISDLGALAFSVAGNELLWSGHVEGGVGGLHAAPWEEPARFIRNSPAYAVDRVHTPVLLFHGTEDGVPIAQSEAFYSGLRRLGRTAVLVRYHGEGHGLRDWSAETQADFWRRTFEWLERHVRA